MNRAEYQYAPTAHPGYTTVGSELTETDKEPPFFTPDFPFFRGERTLVPFPLATPLYTFYIIYAPVMFLVALNLNSVK